MGLLLRHCNRFLFQKALPRSLPDGHVLLVGDNLCGNRQMEIPPSIEVRLTNPSIEDFRLRGGGKGLCIGHVRPQNSPAKEYPFAPTVTTRSREKALRARTSWHSRPDCARALLKPNSNA